MKNKKYKILAVIIVVIILCLGVYFGLSLKSKSIEEITQENTVENNIQTYEMTNDDVEELSTTEITEQTEAEEETTVIVSATDKKQFFKLNSALKTYYAVFAITITSDNKVKFQCCDLEGWQWKDNIQLEQVLGI